MINICRILVVAVCGILSGCSHPQAPDDHRGTSIIAFEEFSVAIALKDERHKFRLDGVVNDLDEHMHKVLREFGLTGAPLSFANPSTHGRTTSWTGSGGDTWAISYILSHADE